MDKLDPDIERKIGSLEEKITAARKDQADDKIKQYGVPADENEPSKGHNIASQFLATVISGGIFGYIVDRFFDTGPWGMMGFILIGFVAGVRRANAAMKKND